VYEHVARKHYELDRIFPDEGESAKTDARPALQEMLRYCKQNKGRIQVVIFPKVDRFARYAEDYHYLKGYLRKLRIRVESIDEHFDDSPSGRFFESMLAASAQFDNDVRSERAINGSKEAIVAGRYYWRPKGYRRAVVGKHVTSEPDPKTVPIVVEVFNRLASGEFRAKDGRAWLASQEIKLSRNAFYNMIHNKIYIGLIEKDGVSIPTAPPLVPLISEKVFYRAQAAIRPVRMPRHYQRDNPDFPLRGTLRCPKGHLLTGGWAKGRHAKYPYYRCKHCRQVNWRKEPLEQQVLALFETLKKHYPLSKPIRTLVIQAWKSEQAARSLLRQKLEQEVKRLVDLQKALALKNAQGILPDDLAKEQIAELERKVIEKKILLADREEKSVSIERVIEHCNAFLSRLGHYWAGSSLEIRKQVLRFFFPGGATVNADGLIRTASDSPFAGLQRLSLSYLSCQVRPADKSANHRALHDLMEAVYREFPDASN